MADDGSRFRLTLEHCADKPPCGIGVVVPHCGPSRQSGPENDLLRVDPWSEATAAWYHLT